MFGIISVSTSLTPDEKNSSPKETQKPTQELHDSHCSVSSMYSVRVIERAGKVNSIIKHLDAYLSKNQNDNYLLLTVNPVEQDFQPGVSDVRTIIIHLYQHNLNNPYVKLNFLRVADKIPTQKPSTFVTNTHTHITSLQQLMVYVAAINWSVFS